MNRMPLLFLWNFFCGVNIYPYLRPQKSDTMKKDGFWHRVFDLYYEGFRSMKLGKVLWAVILIKLFIIFVVLKIFFFPNFLKEHAREGEESEYVASELIRRNQVGGEVKEVREVNEVKDDTNLPIDRNQLSIE